MKSFTKQCHGRDFLTVCGPKDYTISCDGRDLFHPFHKRVFGFLNTSDRFIGWDPLDWVRWGQKNIQPFLDDYTKTFEDLT